jgi:hypothetical protein
MQPVKQFLCQVSFMTKSGKNTVRFAKTIWEDSQKKDLAATQDIFKNYQVVKAEFARDESQRMWYNRDDRNDSGDCKRKFAYITDPKTIPEVIFKSICGQLRKIFPLIEITTATNIKDMLDQKYNTATCTGNQGKT